MKLLPQLHLLRSCIIGLFKALSYGLRSTGEAILILHLQETGLREQVEPVIEWLLRHDECRIIIIVREVQKADYLRQSTLPLYDNARITILIEEHFLSRLYRPAVVLSLHPESPSCVAMSYGVAKMPFRVVMQHGLPDKETFYVDDGRGDTLSCYDGIFLFGPSSREGTLRHYAERFPAKFKRLSIFDVGYPKTDALLTTSFDRSSFISSQGLNPEFPTVCYAPTYQKNASLEQHGMEIIHRLASLGVNVLVKLHHVSLKSPVSTPEPWVMEETGGKDWRAVISAFEREHPNVRLATVHNANPCLLASDVLVTDVSGVAFEFLLLDRPIIFVDVPLLFKQFGTTGIHYWGRSCGAVVTLDELIGSVVEVLENPGLHAEHRRELRDRLVYNPGRGSEAAGQKLQQLMRGVS